MKKIKIALQNGALIGILIFGFLACDQEFATIGSSILGDNNFVTNSESFPVITYNQNIGPIQSNNLSSNLLGFNNDPLYGNFTANIVSQMTVSEFDPAFGENVVLDSVVLLIPYFSSVVDTDEEGNNLYELDSVFGDTPIRLSVYENNYFLRSFNPDLEFEDQLAYFSDRTASDGSIISASDLEGELLFSDDAFEVSAEQINLEELDVEGEPFVSTRLAPAIRVLLDNPNDFWENLIFDKEGEPELSNQSNFQNHFRGLYIKAEAMDVNGTMMLLSFGSNASIFLYYTSDIEVDDEVPDEEITTEPGTYSLTFSGNKVNFFESNFINIPDGNQTQGDEKLYLKGAEGSMAVVNLFNGDEDGNSLELDDFRSQNWLINEANLVFYVDQSSILGEEPDRIFIYDVDNGAILIDYLIDQSISPEFLSGKIDHLHPLERVDDDPQGEGIKYKIEITEHINNIFLNDSTNTKLGILVTTDVNSIQSLDIKDVVDLPEKIISGSVLSTRGTVLFGNNTTEEDKKVKFEIFYTEPDN